MCSATRARSTREKLAIFRACFSGRPDAYGTYDPQTGRVWQVRRAVTDRVLLRHLQGHQPYGVYLLVGERTRSLAVDFDDHDLNPPMDFVAAAANNGISAYIEASKSKGYHVWMFFEAQGVSAARARGFADQLLREVGTSETEVFPKHDRLDERAPYGNFINAPLFGRLVPQGRTVFLDERDLTKPHPDQWGLLANVDRVSARVLDEVLGAESMGEPDPPHRNRGAAGDRRPSVTLGLPPCAQRMLTQGVTGSQRVACFRLAVQLKKAGLPADLAIAVLNTWARKNRPMGRKRLITPQEIAAQTNCAYARPYSGCGCEDPAVSPYCDPNCTIRRHATPRVVQRVPPSDGTRSPGAQRKERPPTQRKGSR